MLNRTKLLLDRFILLTYGLVERKAAFSSFHDSAAMESAAVAGLGGRAVGVKAIGSVLGNGLTRNGRLKAMTSRSRGNLLYKANKQMEL